MAHRITLIPGDGIGPEVIEAARRVVEATGVNVEWDLQWMGAGAFSRTGDPLPQETLASIERNAVALKGPIETPVTSGLRSVNLAMRQDLDLFALRAPVQPVPGRAERLRGGGPDRRAREHRGHVHGDRVRDGDARDAELIRFVGGGRTADPRGHRDLRQDDLRSAAANGSCEFAFDWAAARGPADRHRRTQGEHHEVHGRVVPGGGARVAAAPSRHRVRGSDHRRALHAADPGAGAVRRAASCRTSTATWSCDVAAGLIGGSASRPAVTSGSGGGVRGDPRHRAAVWPARTGPIRSARCSRRHDAPITSVRPRPRSGSRPRSRRSWPKVSI